MEMHELEVSQEFMSADWIDELVNEHVDGAILTAGGGDVLMLVTLDRLVAAMPVKSFRGILACVLERGCRDPRPCVAVESLAGNTLKEIRLYELAKTFIYAPKLAVFRDLVFKVGPDCGAGPRRYARVHVYLERRRR